MKHIEYRWEDIVADTKDLKTYSFKNSKWESHLGGLSEGDMGLLHGEPGGGKTYYTLQLCKELQRTYGGVLFIEHEETKKVISNGKVTGYTFRKTFGRKCEKIKPTGVTILPDFPRNADGAINGQYLKKFKFIFVDSATVFGLDYEQMQELSGLFPKAVFVFIYQSTKGGSHRGSQKDTHGVDFEIKVEKGIAFPKKTRLEGIEPYDIFEDFPQKSNPNETKTSNSSNKQPTVKQPTAPKYKKNSRN